MFQNYIHIFFAPERPDLPGFSGEVGPFPQPSISEIAPKTRHEKFLAKIAGAEIDIEPRTRTEKLLNAIAEHKPDGESDALVVNFELVFDDDTEGIRIQNVTNTVSEIIEHVRAGGCVHGCFNMEEETTQIFMNLNTSQILFDKTSCVFMADDGTNHIVVTGERPENDNEDSWTFEIIDNISKEYIDERALEVVAIDVNTSTNADPANRVTFKNEYNSRTWTAKSIINAAFSMCPIVLMDRGGSFGYYAFVGGRYFGDNNNSNQAVFQAMSQSNGSYHKQIIVFEGNGSITYEASVST